MKKINYWVCKMLRIEKYKHFITLIGLIFIASCAKQNLTSSQTKLVSSKEIFNDVIFQIRESTKNQILVCAHRGYHRFAPENSIEAIKQSIAEKIDIVELDITTTKDGKFVLMHDKTIDRTTTGSGYVSQFTLSELKKFNLKIGDSITTHKIPTLKEVIAVAKDKIILNLDIKNVDISKFYNQLKSSKIQNKIFSYMWDKEKIKQITTIDPSYAVLPIVSNKSDIEFYLNNIDSKLQHFNESSFNKENMKFAKKNGVLVFMNSLWKVDKAFVAGRNEAMNQIINLRPAIIQTDNPKLLIKYLKSKKLHN